MLKPICIPCQRFHRCIKIGFLFIEGKPTSFGQRKRVEPGTLEPHQWVPYKIWNGDLYECQGCGHLTVAGVCQKPVSIDWMTDFDHWLQRVDEQHVFAYKVGRTFGRLIINDC
jgi:hypothetical protein